MEELLRFTRALVALQLYTARAAAATPGAAPLRAELLFADAGLSPREIATLLGKSPGAVAKAITRGRSVRRGPAELNDQILQEGVLDDA